MDKKDLLSLWVGVEAVLSPAEFLSHKTTGIRPPKEQRDSFTHIHALPTAVGSGQVNRHFGLCRIVLAWNGEFKEHKIELLAVIYMAHNMEQVCHDHSRKNYSKVLNEMILRRRKGSPDSYQVT